DGDSLPRGGAAGGYDGGGGRVRRRRALYDPAGRDQLGDGRLDLRRPLLTNLGYDGDEFDGVSVRPYRPCTDAATVRADGSGGGDAGLRHPDGVRVAPGYLPRDGHRRDLGDTPGGRKAGGGARGCGRGGREGGG